MHGMGLKTVLTWNCEKIKIYFWKKTILKENMSHITYLVQCFVVFIIFLPHSVVYCLCIFWVFCFIFCIKLLSCSIILLKWMQIALTIKPVLENKVWKGFFVLVIYFSKHIFYGYNITHPENTSICLKLEWRV